MAMVIGGYEQATDWRTVGSGSARWCIVRQGSQRFFLKEFLKPVYPAAREDAPLTVKQRERCQAFEGGKNRLYAALSCVIGDTLVPVLDFFREGSRYYALSEEVPNPFCTAEDVPRLSMRARRELLYTLAVCLQRLHVQGVVHADLKPEHLLLRKTEDGYRLRLIDMDSGFLESEPPAQEQEMEGDPVYLAPETFLHLMGEPVRLNHRVDTFAMGMIIHRLWTGELPKFDRERFAYLYEASLEGAEIRLASELPLAYRFPVQRMLRADPEERPSDAEIVRLLAEVRNEMVEPPHGDAPVNEMMRLFKQ